MKIAFHDLTAQYQVYKEEINEAIQSVLDSSSYIMGPSIINFEKSLANYLNANHVISCASGTDALLLSLMAIDIKPGEEVITTPFTFIATAEVISLLGAKPIFVDIEPDTYNIDAKLIEAKITNKTRAIIPVSLFGQTAEMNTINDIATYYAEKNNRKIYVIEDAAQSLGATYHEKKSSNLSDVGCLSFFPSKPLGCYGDGGAVVTNDDVLAEKMKSLRVHGQTKRYYHQYIGFNCRLDSIQAAILSVKLKYFESELQKRKSIANDYEELLSNCKVTLPTIKPGRTSVFAQYSISVDHREKIINFLKSKDIPINVHYPKPLHLQPCFAYLQGKEGDFPIAEKSANQIMSLPMSAFVTPIQQEFISNMLRQAIGTLPISKAM